MKKTDKVVFKSKVIEKAVTEFLNVSAEDLTSADLFSIKSLQVCVIGTNCNKVSFDWNKPHLGIRDFKEITKPELVIEFKKDITISSNMVKDLSKFWHVQVLYLNIRGGNLSFLSKFYFLQELYISDSYEDDWSFLKNLVGLRSLSLKSCYSFTLSSVSELCKIQYESILNELGGKSKFNVDMNGLRHYMMNFGIEEFGLSEKDFDIFCKKTLEVYKQDKVYFPLNVLTNLSVTDGTLEDIYSIHDCKFVKRLNLSENPLDNIKPIYNLNLIYLDLSETVIDDLHPIFNLKNLVTLCVHGTLVYDLKPLDYLIPYKLRYATVNGDVLDPIELTELIEENFSVSDLGVLVILEKV